MCHDIVGTWYLWHRWGKWVDGERDPIGIRYPPGADKAAVVGVSVIQERRCTRCNQLQIRHETSRL